MRATVVQWTSFPELGAYVYNHRLSLPDPAASGPPPPAQVSNEEKKEQARRRPPEPPDCSWQARSKLLELDHCARLRITITK